MHPFPLVISALCFRTIRRLEAHHPLFSHPGAGMNVLSGVHSILGTLSIVLERILPAIAGSMPDMLPIAFCLVQGCNMMARRLPYAVNPHTGSSA